MSSPFSSHPGYGSGFNEVLLGFLILGYVNNLLMHHSFLIWQDAVHVPSSGIGLRCQVSLSCCPLSRFPACACTCVHRRLHPHSSSGVPNLVTDAPRLHNIRLFHTIRSCLVRHPGPSKTLPSFSCYSRFRVPQADSAIPSPSGCQPRM